MPYTESIVEAIGPGGKTGTTGDFGASDVPLYRVNQACDLFAVGALITVVLDTALATLTVTRRTLPGSDGSGATAATAVAIVTIPDLTGVGKIVWKDCHILTVKAPVKLNAGDELVFTMSSGGGSFKWRPWFEAYPRREVKANNTDFLQSA